MELARSSSGCIAVWPEASPCSGHGECVHINGTAPYCICDAGWNGNGDFATRADDCHINEIASTVIWAFASLIILIQLLVGMRYLLVWHNHRRTIPAGHSLHAIYGSWCSMIQKDQPLLIILIHQIHALVSLPLSVLHLWNDGPRMGDSWWFTWAAAFAWYIVAVLQYYHGMVSFTLYTKLASRHITVNESYTTRYKAILITTCILLVVGFTVSVAACADHSLQDAMLINNVIMGVISGYTAGLTRAYYQWRIIQRLTAPDMIKTLNNVQRVERQRAAKKLREYAIPLLLSAIGPGAMLIIIGCSYWARARIQYFGALNVIPLSLLGLQSFKTYHPMRASTVVVPVTITALATKHQHHHIHDKSIALGTADGTGGGNGGAMSTHAPLQWASSRYVTSDHRSHGHGQHSNNGNNNNNNNTNGNGNIALESVSHAPVAGVTLGVSHGQAHAYIPERSHNGLLSPTLVKSP